MAGGKSGNNDDKLDAIETAVRVAGDDAAEQLLIDFGGRKYYFPILVDPDHELAKKLGLKAAQAICDEIGGVTVYIPMPGSRVAVRRSIVRKRTIGGENAATIAFSLRVCERVVSKDRGWLIGKGLLPAGQATGGRLAISSAADE